MPSKSLEVWQTERAASLDEIEAAHASVGGTARGRRYATQQINQAYAVLLSSQFQGFCRDLHDECADHFIQRVPANLQRSIRELVVANRKLDKGNPHPDNIGLDYNRFGLAFWDEVRRVDGRNRGRRQRLLELNSWRNAIAHQDFNMPKLGAAVLRLRSVRNWRAACDQLASAFDEVMRLYFLSLNRVSPW